jgi:phenylacetaldehyde dehydrogenase
MPSAAPPQSTAARFLDRVGNFLIDGEWLKSISGDMSEAVDPATGDVLARVAAAGIPDVDAAVAAARRSFDDKRWRGLSGDERAKILWRIAELVEAHAEELGELESRNGGGLMTMMPLLVGDVAECFRYYAGACTKIHGRSADFNRWGASISHHTRLEPVGVVGLIVPWNSPLGMAAWKLAPALAAGCSVILKPADETPITALRLGELMMEAGVPPGVVNIVTGPGATIGARLGAHPDVDKVSFTGSTAVGKSLITAAAGNLKRLTLELGGKSPFIICADADLDQAIPAAANAIFTHAGQVCSAGSRLYIARQVYDQVVAALIGHAAAIKIGSPRDPATQMGPLVSAKQLARVRAMVAAGRDEGAVVVHGGERFGSAGFFMEPTVLVGTTPAMRVVREEIFGPVVVASPFDSIDEAVALANDSIYGLAAYVWTRDIRVANRLANEIRAGTVWVNCILLLDYSAPFGGFKQSGWGREHGPDGINAYLETKSVMMAI